MPVYPALSCLLKQRLKADSNFPQTPPPTLAQSGPYVCPPPPGVGGECKHTLVTAITIGRPSTLSERGAWFWELELRLGALVSAPSLA